MAFRGIVVDRPGCGLSPELPQPFDDVERLRSFAGAFVGDVLDGLDVARAHVVATSFGGLIALHSAAATPERIDRMVLFGWSVGAPIGAVPLVMRVASAPALGRVMTAMPVNEWMVRALLRRIGVADPSDDLVRTYTALLRHTDTMRNELAAGPRIVTPRGMNASILIPDETLAAVQAPTHLIWGEVDTFGGADVARAFSSKIPGATLEVLPGVGHAPWLDQPERCAAATWAFLEQ